MKKELVKELVSDLELGVEDLDKFIKDHEGAELTEDILTYDDEEHNVIWYADYEAGIEGFIDIETSEVFTPEWNRIDFLEAMMNYTSLEEVIEDYNLNRKEIRAIQLRNII